MVRGYDALSIRCHGDVTIEIFNELAVGHSTGEVPLSAEIADPAVTAEKEVPAEPGVNSVLEVTAVPEVTAGSQVDVEGSVEAEAECPPNTDAQTIP